MSGINSVILFGRLSGMPRQTTYNDETTSVFTLTTVTDGEEDVHTCIADGRFSKKIHDLHVDDFVGVEGVLRTRMLYLKSGRSRKSWFVQVAKIFGSDEQ